MAISETKKKIVINNYFKAECDVNTSIREAYEKGFERGLIKAPNKVQVDTETTRNISGRNPIDKFVCEKCGFMVDGWTAFNFEDETDDRFDYEFAFKFCPSCGRRVEK